MENKKFIFGFVGLLSSGKGTAGQYLQKKYKASFFTFSQVLRDVLKRFHLEISRDYMIKLSEIMREAFGEDLLSKNIAQDVSEAETQYIVVDGIRRESDLIHLSQLPGFVLVAIEASEQVRYERLVKRGQNTDDATKTFEQFKADHTRSTEMSILDVLPLAIEHIDNNGTLEQLHAQLDALVKKYTA
ncbi:MAG: hypothetical protein UU76_C0027G0002 [Parcubacteria group bacterium GW2011_GWC1_41_7]|nr:MAG: hypothetical protein UU76_C0027G0002 [Parcubacteria group bacterium GW2011_GWC1_41_7]